MTEDRCEDCGRRFDRPADPYCAAKPSHAQGDAADRIAQAIESDLGGRRGLGFGDLDLDLEIQDEIRLTWANKIRGILRQECMW